MMQLYWSPRSRSFSALWLMEETGQPYERVLTDISTGAQKAPDYLAVNPMGKVPALKDGEATLAEVVFLEIPTATPVDPSATRDMDTTVAMTYHPSQPQPRLRTRPRAGPPWWLILAFAVAIGAMLLGAVVKWLWRYL